MTTNLNIEQLYAMPQLEHFDGEDGEEGGYRFADKYQDKLFSFEGKIIVFDKNKLHEVPIAIINLLTDILSESFINSEELTNQKDEILGLLNTTVEMFSNDNIKINKRLDNCDQSLSKIDTREIRDNINDLQDLVLSQVAELEAKINNLGDLSVNINKLSSDFNSTISSMVDSKLVDVHKNFNLIVNQLVTSEVDKIKGLVLESANKLKPATIMLYKELGVTIEQIIQMKKEGII